MPLSARTNPAQRCQSVGGLPSTGRATAAKPTLGPATLAALVNAAYDNPEGFRLDTGGKPTPILGSMKGADDSHTAHGRQS